MILNEYHDLAQRTAKQFPTMQGNLTHAALGLSTEFLEAMTAISSVHVQEEIGDMIWYLPVLSAALGWRLGDIVAEYLTIPAEVTTADRLQAEKNPWGIGISQHGCQAVGNIVTMVKRVVVYDKALTSDMLSQVRNDIVNCMTYSVRIARSHGFTLSDALKSNIDKLRVRYPNAYSNEAAEARADKVMGAGPVA